MPRNRRPMPRIAVNYDVLVGETLERVTNSQLGLWLRGVAWAAENGRPWVPQGLLRIYSDEEAQATYRADAQALVDAGLFEECPDQPTYYQMGPLGYALLVPVRQAIPAQTRAQIMERDGYRCRRCLSTSKLTIDHIKPISRGGTNIPENLQILCGSCNSTKGARVL